MANFCMKCGKKLSEDSSFCMYCGEPVPILEEEAENRPVSQNSRRKAVSKNPAKVSENRSGEKTKPVKPETATKRKAADRKSTAEKESAHSAKTAEKSSGGKLVMAALLIVALLFTAFVKPGFLKKKEPVYYGGLTGNGNTPIETVTNTNDPIADPLPEKDGNSKALSYSPREGFHIEAAADAFVKDTEFTIEPLEEVGEEVFTAVKELENEGLYPVYGYEIDGGMADNEVAPGEYQVSFDLSLTGLDEDLYPCVEIYRIADDGSFYECASEVKDGKITYRADQNSVVMSVVNASLVARGYSVWLEEDSSKYDYYTFRKKRNYLKGENKYMKYEIDWVNKDIGIEMTEEISQVQKLVEKYSKAVEEEARTEATSILDIFTKNSRSIHKIKKKLEKDPEYQKLAKVLDLPEPIKILKKSINLGIEYLATQEGIRTPTGVIKIHAVRTLKGRFAEAEKKEITVALKDAVDQGETGINNLTLTMTHELLHVCQRRYRMILPINDSMNDSVKFDEMAAGYTEARALSYFVKEELFDRDAIPQTTDKNQWSSLKFPIDKEYTAGGALLQLSENRDDYFSNDFSTQEWDPNDWFVNYINKLMINEGYNLAYFLDYLCAETGNAVKADTLMRARNFKSQTGISQPLKTVFKLNEESFRKYYRGFISEYRNTIRKEYTDSFWYKTNMVKLLKPGMKRYITLSHEGDYSIDAHSFRASTKQEDVGSGSVKDPMSMLIVLDKDLQKLHPQCELLPVEEGIAAKKGIFLPPLEFDSLENKGFRTIIDIHTGETEEAYQKETGYSVYVFGKTCTVEPEVTAGKLRVTIKDKSEAAKDKVIDGYLLTVNAGNIKITQELEPDDIKAPILIEDKQLYKDPDTLSKVKVKVCPYVLSADGNKLFTEESDEKQLTQGMVWVLDTIYYPSHVVIPPRSEEEIEADRAAGKIVESPSYHEATNSYDGNVFHHSSFWYYLYRPEEVLKQNGEINVLNKLEHMSDLINTLSQKKSVLIYNIYLKTSAPKLAMKDTFLIVMKDMVRKQEDIDVIEKFMSEIPDGAELYMKTDYQLAFKYIPVPASEADSHKVTHKESSFIDDLNIGLKEPLK